MTSDDYVEMNERAEQLAEWVLVAEEYDEVKHLRASLQPIGLEQLHDPTRH